MLPTVFDGEPRLADATQTMHRLSRNRRSPPGGSPCQRLAQPAEHRLPTEEQRAERGEGEVVAKRRRLPRRRQPEELRDQLRMALDHRIQHAPGPEVAGRVVPPLHPRGLARLGGDRPRHHEHQLVRLVLHRQATQFPDLPESVRRGERLHPLALEDEAPAVLPRHHVAPTLSARFPRMLGPLEALGPDEPQAQALEVESRELLERERVRGGGQGGLGHGAVEREV